jgi:hypothetical protein
MASVSALWGDAHAGELEHFGRVALFDRDLVARLGRQIDRRGRRSYVKRKAMYVRQHGNGIGPDLVRHVAIRRDAVGPDDRHVDLAARHQVPGHVVGDHRVRDPLLLELPRGEAGALQEGTSLVDEHV